MIELCQLLPHLQCPRSGTSLSLQQGALCSTAGHTYSIIDGKPILVRVPQPMHSTPPSPQIVARNIQEFVLDPSDPPDGLVLHLGCGDVPCHDRRVVSVDVLPTEAADLVAEAEALPFRDNTFDRVVSGAVFEHVYDPIRSAKEVRRVLKEGGSFYIDTAFLQGYHGFPSHYFNMTPQAVETFLVDGFALIYSGVGDNATVGHTIKDTLRRFLDGLPADKAAILLNMSVREMLAELEADFSRKNRFIGSLSEYSHRALAAGFVVIAQKPRGYADCIDQPDREREAIILRNYYTARMAVIQRHHEVEYYRRAAIDQYPEFANEEEAPSLNDILSGTGRPPDNCSFLEATLALRVRDEALTNLRDKWISAPERGRLDRPSQ
jgi:SAM-dependent methyltransferase